MSGARRGNARRAGIPARMSSAEHPLIFDCDGDRLVGVLTQPETPARTGVIIVVGGPQYRAGSHRQFVLLARAIAQAGFAALRFDYRGMGDSEGTARTFEETSGDIAAAIGALRKASSSIVRVVLWGLCDGASAALMYVADSRVHAGDSRDRSENCGATVSGLVLVNPWVRSEATFAKTQIRHYYLRRLFERTFWSKLLQGQVRIGASLGDLRRVARTAADARADAPVDGTAFQERMLAGFAAFHGPVLLLMSDRDLTAREFDQHVASSAGWRALLARPSIFRSDIAGADHTFSLVESRLEAERATIEWLRERIDAGPR